MMNKFFKLSLYKNTYAVLIFLSDLKGRKREKEKINFFLQLLLPVSQCECGLVVAVTRFKRATLGLLFPCSLPNQSEIWGFFS